MSRPAWIAALDVALNASMDRCDKGDAAITAFLAQHITVVDEYRNLQNARATSYSDVRHTEDVIRSLGYVALKADGSGLPKNESRLGDRSYNGSADELAARTPTPPTPVTPKGTDDE